MRINTASIGKLKTDEASIINTIVIHLVLLACKNMLVSTSPKIYEYNSVLNILILLLLIVLYSKCILFDNLFGRMSSLAYLFLSFLVIFIGITFFLDPIRFISKDSPYNFVRSQLKTYIVYCLPLFIAFNGTTDMDLLLDKLYKTVNIQYIFATLSFICYLVNPAREYSMSYGYHVLFLCMLTMFKYVELRKKSLIVCVMIEILYIVVAGSRGPLVCIFFMIILVVLVYSNRRIKGFFLGSVTGSILLFILFYKQVIDVIIEIAKELGINSRTILLLQYGLITYDAGRKPFYDGIIRGLVKKPFIGLGAFGGEATVGRTHSLFLDCFANFGLVFGSFIIVIFLLCILLLFCHNKYSSKGVIIAILALMILPGAFFNGGIWETKELWMLLGIILCGTNTNRMSFVKGRNN